MMNKISLLKMFGKAMVYAWAAFFFIMCCYTTFLLVMVRSDYYPFWLAEPSQMEIPIEYQSNLSEIGEYLKRTYQVQGKRNHIVVLEIESQTKHKWMLWVEEPRKFINIAGYGHIYQNNDEYRITGKIIGYENFIRGEKNAEKEETETFGLCLLRDHDDNNGGSDCDTKLN